MATKLLTGKPAEPSEDGSVVRFRKWDSAYSYAAIRIDGYWFLTQGKMARVSPRRWDEFLDWVGEEGWPSLELLS
ncbi:hypothetical protein SEA_REFUGE_79 [Mycobacterium phage Refuge]|uniref:Uncharacterized protein n=1 Tax=Mycobacterium phage Refuge TaxID=2517967 RepID=A0A482JBE7_9CAUD|nr:hypothetical protein KIV61_gp24 [Mycobacterium phage Refuge]QBP31097.1 hypothetical protein SEA_REFUGE_79 [Mycobacterium phage Refuge]